MDEEQYKRIETAISHAAGHMAANTMALKAIVAALPKESADDFAQALLALTNHRLQKDGREDLRDEDDAIREVTEALLQIARLPR